jgi:hypothetical protein
MRMRRCLFVICAALMVLVTAPRLSAFGAVGHHVVARIAWALMTPAAQDRAAALLDGRLDVFVAASTWADEVRGDRPQTYNWHFVDIPVGLEKYEPKRDCPASDRGDCVIAAIARARAELADAGRSKELRAESLKYLIHFVGDIHQPLHAIDNLDRGGNDVRVAPLREDGRTTNLHSTWDTGLINLSPETEAARADRLVATIRKDQPVSLNVIQWAEDSHRLAATVAYSYDGFKIGGLPAEPLVLPQPYRDKAIATIDAQLTLAGARLGAILNEILGK